MSTLKKIKRLYPSLSNLSVGNVVNVKDIPTLCTQIDKFKKTVTPKLMKKGCYKNAYICMEFFAKKGIPVEYVEGFVETINPRMTIEHAWNAVVIDGVRYMFDATSSELFNAIIFTDYIEVYSSKDVVTIARYIKKQFITATYQKIDWKKPTPFMLSLT